MSNYSANCQSTVPNVKKNSAKCKNRVPIAKIQLPIAKVQQVVGILGYYYYHCQSIVPIVKIHIIAHCQSTTGKVQQVVGIPWVTALSIALSAFCNHPTSAFPIQSWESICTFICIHICVSTCVNIFCTLRSLD